MMVSVIAPIVENVMAVKVVSLMATMVENVIAEVVVSVIAALDNGKCDGRSGEECEGWRYLDVFTELVLQSLPAFTPAQPQQDGPYYCLLTLGHRT